MEAPTKPVDQGQETIRQYVAELIRCESAWYEGFIVEEAATGFPIQPPRAGSPLAAAGVRGGDRLLAVDDQAVHSVGEIHVKDH